MKVRDIYRKYNITPNLQEHMLRVASVGGYICDHLSAGKGKKEDVLKVLLLHDLGNTVRFDLEKFPHFLGTELKRLEYWKTIIKEMKAKYGEDDHEATDKILAELKVPSKLRKVTGEMVLSNVLQVIEGNDILVKICLYSDMRVGPGGIVSLKERLDDAFARHLKFQSRMDLYQGAFKLEEQIAESLEIPTFEINATTVKIDRDRLLNFELEGKIYL